MFFQLVLFWLSMIASGRRPNGQIKPNSTGQIAPKTSNTKQDDFSSRSYGFKEPQIYHADGFKSDAVNLPTASSKFVPQEIREPEVDDYGEPEKSERPDEPEKTDSSERLSESEKPEEPEDEDFEQVKKVKEVSSIISLKPKERNKALDPITDQQGHVPMRIVRPMRDLSIIVRNRHHPLLIARQVPIHWVPRINRHHHHPPQKPHKPSMPKHKPCKPCDPKVHKKLPHKPKKPKKKPKKGHCHHQMPKKPHHKRLLYYAPMPTAMNYYYGNRMPAKRVIPNNSYDVKESLENEDVEVETEKPFHQEVEDDVEEHRLAELSEPFDDEDPSETEMKPFENL